MKTTKEKSLRSKLILLSLLIIGMVIITYSFIVPAAENTVAENEMLESKIPERNVPVAAATENKVADISGEELRLRTDMRKLWEDHVTWTRNVIFNIIDGMPGTDEAVKRLLKNQDEIGDAIRPYYGSEAGKQLTDLLHTHINQAAELLKAAKGNDNVGFDQIKKKWQNNADEIAVFLSKANPHWKENEMKKMMQDHLTLTINEAVARKKKNYSADVVAYDKVHDEILEMSDMLSMGIVMQFPNKFKEVKEVGVK